MKFLKPIPVFCAALVLLVGCATLGLAPATSLTDRIGYGNSQVIALATSATDSFRAGRITRDEARHVSSVSKQAGEILDLSAVAIGQGDISTAEARLALANDMLIALEHFLKAKEAK